MLHRSGRQVDRSKITSAGNRSPVLEVAHEAKHSDSVDSASLAAPRCSNTV
jgi:hypothetical protein